ncbi:MAG: tetratricopeptide repeat protein [Planctomycetota bacterium]
MHASRTWKEVTYLIGRIYEGAGRKAEAMAEYEKIAGLDLEGQGGLVTAPLRPTDPPWVPPRPGEAAAGPEEAGA